MALDWKLTIKGALIGALIGILTGFVINILGGIIGGVVAGWVARKTRSEAVISGAFAGLLVFAVWDATVQFLSPLTTGIFSGFLVVAVAAIIFGAFGGLIGHYIFRDKNGS